MLTVADKEETKAEEIIGSSRSKAKSKKGQSSGGGGMLWLGVLVIVVVACAASGFYIGSMLKSAEASPNDAAPRIASPPDASGEDGEGYSYYDLEPITINLDEPRLARYVRATITLAYEPRHEADVLTQLERRMPELKNWLAVYLAGLTLDEVRGAQSLNRVRREIGEAFNQQIWPQQPPKIHHVLLKEFAVQ